MARVTTPRFEQEPHLFAIAWTRMTLGFALIRATQCWARARRSALAKRQHVLLKVIGDERCNFPDAVVGGQERAEADGAVERTIQLLDVRHVLGLGEGEELGIESLDRDGHLARRQVMLIGSVVSSSIDSAMEYLSM